MMCVECEELRAENERLREACKAELKRLRAKLPAAKDYRSWCHDPTHKTHWGPDHAPAKDEDAWLRAIDEAHKP